jgi:hypothetical protein
MTDAQSLIVSEISMQEWAMLAFKAERAPRRAVTTPRPAEAVPVRVGAVAGARTMYWLLLAAAMSTTLLF